ncbi:MAG TPA: hypothetical protein VFK05_31380 [Polyangiaceae bacterium]|nr:hypothetical protein [Polyangiaceae bacterium]
MPKSSQGWLLSFLLAACSRDPKPEARPSVATASAASVATASAASAALAAVSTPPSAGAAPQRRDLSCSKGSAVEASSQLLDDWNRALNSHDLTLLEKAYASRVAFYGRDLSRTQVLAAKRRALAATPNYKQHLSDVRFAPEADSAASITFDKASAGAKTVRGRLLIQCDGEHYGIATESDAPSDALAKGQTHEDCEAAMYAVAFDLPEVKREQAYATDEAPFGGLSYPFEGKHVAVALGFHHPERFEATFFLDWDKGVFTINQGEVKVPAASQKRVQAACPK